MGNTRIRTRRLDLVPATAEIFSCDIGNRDGLARLLNAAIPPAWPPEDMTGDVLAVFLQTVTERSDPLFACWYWVLDEPETRGRVLAGSGGVGSVPGSPGSVVIGYSVAGGFRNRGIATEAVRAIAGEVFKDPRIDRILATTFPARAASIRVLTKTGFSCTGPASPGQGFTEGTLAFVLERRSFREAPGGAL